MQTAPLGEKKKNHSNATTSLQLKCRSCNSHPRHAQDYTNDGRDNESSRFCLRRAKNLTYFTLTVASNICPLDLPSVAVLSTSRSLAYVRHIIYAATIQPAKTAAKRGRFRSLPVVVCIVGTLQGAQNTPFETAQLLGTHHILSSFGFVLIVIC